MHSTISLIDSDAVRLSPALQAVEAFVQHVEESIMPYFCLRGQFRAPSIDSKHNRTDTRSLAFSGDAAFEVLTGVRMEKGFHGYVSYFFASFRLCGRSFEESR